MSSAIELDQSAQCATVLIEYTLYNYIKRPWPIGERAAKGLVHRSVLLCCAVFRARFHVSFLSHSVLNFHHHPLLFNPFPGHTARVLSATPLTVMLPGPRGACGALSHFLKLLSFFLSLPAHTHCSGAISAHSPPAKKEAPFHLNSFHLDESFSSTLPFPLPSLVHPATGALCGVEASTPPPAGMVEIRFLVSSVLPAFVFLSVPFRKKWGNSCVILAPLLPSGWLERVDFIPIFA